MHVTIDTIVMLVFSSFILVIGLLFSRTGRNLPSFFAGGEAVPWLVGGLSLFMSFFSAGTFVAWGSIAYAHGWVAVTIQWTMCVGALITAVYLAPKWKSTGNLTAAEFIKERLGERVQKMYIYIFMLVSVFMKASVLYSVARLVGSSLGFGLVPTTIVLGIWMIAYTAVGGLWAVMVTDILQFVVLTAAVVILVPLAFQATGGVEAFVKKAPAQFFALTGGEYDGGFLVAFALYHIFYIGGNWTFVQRYTSVDSPKSASKVAYLFAALYLVCPVVWMLPPMIFRTIHPGLSGLDTENAYLMVCKQVLPAGLMGLILTGMYFSTSASANTALNVVSAVFTNDIYKGTFRPNASDRTLMRVARRSSWGFGLGMIGIALVVPYIGGIVAFTLGIAAVTGGPLLAPPLWALVSRRLTPGAALAISLVSLGVNLAMKLGGPGLGLAMSKGMEMLIGLGFPLLLLVLNEWRGALQGESACVAYRQYVQLKALRTRLRVLATDVEEQRLVRQQNRFGLRIISFSLVFTAVMLGTLGLLVDSIASRVMEGLAVVIVFGALIPYRASRRVKVEQKEVVKSVEVV